MEGAPRPFLNKPEQLHGPLISHCKAGCRMQDWSAVAIVSSVSARMSHACGGAQARLTFSAFLVYFSRHGLST